MKLQWCHKMIRKYRIWNHELWTQYIIIPAKSVGPDLKFGLKIAKA